MVKHLRCHPAFLPPGFQLKHVFDLMALDELEAAAIKAATDED